MSQEGVIKFNCNWVKAEPFDFEHFESLNYWRNILYNLGMIGQTIEGIGYGNLSVREIENQFIITGSATGGLETLAREHYTRVISYNIEKNSINANGPIIASSESLTHAAIYQSNSNINAIFHVHHVGLWENYLHKLPTSDISVEYGTPSMAHEIFRLFKETDVYIKRIMIMGGHQDGIIAFGKTLDDAGNALLQYNDHISE